MINGITNILKPTIPLTPIEFYLENSDPKISFDIGYRPMIWYNDLQIDVINSLSLRSSEFIPTISFNFTDSYGRFGNTKFPDNDARIKIFISSRSELLRPIYMEFKIIDFNRLSDGTFNISGVANINELYLKKFQSYPNCSSFNCLLEYSRKAGIGFSSNVNDTEDVMTWVNPANKGKDFIKDVVMNSYRGDTSFMWAYIDFYYNLVYVDIEQQIKEDITSQLGITDGNLGDILNKIGDKANEDLGNLFITNDKMGDQNNNYYKEWSVYNQATKIILQDGYIHKVISYDTANKNILIFDVDTISTEQSNLTSLKRSDDEEFNHYGKWTFTGRMIENNVHENYNYAIVQNTHNLKSLQKIGMEIIMKTPNFNFYRFQKIYNLMISTVIETTDTPLAIQKLSGEWIITEIIYLIIDGEFQQKLKLTRRDLNISQDETV